MFFFFCSYGSPLFFHLLAHPFPSPRSSDLMLSEPWRTITLFNPIVYLIAGFRWTFFGRGDVGIEFSLLFIAGMLALCLAIIGWMFRKIGRASCRERVCQYV